MRAYIHVCMLVCFGRGKLSRTSQLLLGLPLESFQPPSGQPLESISRALSNPPLQSLASQQRQGIERPAFFILFQKRPATGTIARKLLPPPHHSPLRNDTPVSWCSRIAKPYGSTRTELGACPHNCDVGMYDPNAVLASSV